MTIYLFDPLAVEAGVSKRNKMETIRKKLKSLLEMAKRGTVHEQEIAAERLSYLLDKHGLTLDDIKPKNKEVYWFSYRTKFERQLLHQIQYLVTNDNNDEYYRWRGKSHKVGYELTYLDKVEIERLFSFWRNELKKELEICFSAFIQTNKIFGTSSDECADDEIDMERIKKIMLMSQAMERKRPFHQLEAAC